MLKNADSATTTKVKNTINVLEKQPDYDSTYEVPYRNTTEHHRDQNEAVTIENVKIATEENKD